MRAPMYILLVASNAACLRTTEFRCSDNGECSGGGTCQGVGYCSFPDGSCSGGQRFGDSAGPYAGQCVGAQGGEAGVDMMQMIDAAIDSPVGCPSGYMNAGAQPHMYKVITGAIDWNTQANACAATKPGGAYLAIPDDATELGDIDTIATGHAQYWIGISDQAQAGVYKTVKGDTPAILPWAPGQPNMGPPPMHCVKALSATAQFATDKCNTAIVAVCECEP
jgi:hypothetical protein